jgi:hypothetical protein
VHRHDIAVGDLAIGKEAQAPALSQRGKGSSGGGDVVGVVLVDELRTTEDRCIVSLVAPRGLTIVRTLAVVDAYGPDGGFELSTEFTIEVRSRTGQLYSYVSGTGVGPLDPNVGDLEHWFDSVARENFEELLVDLRRDGFEGPDPPTGYEVEWEITDAARETQRRCDATPPDQRPKPPKPVYIPMPESGQLPSEPIVSFRWRPKP